jgi:hypothetical protein
VNVYAELSLHTSHRHLERDIGIRSDGIVLELPYEKIAHSVLIGAMLSPLFA